MSKPINYEDIDQNKHCGYISIANKQHKETGKVEACVIMMFDKNDNLICMHEAALATTITMRDALNEIISEITE